MGEDGQIIVNEGIRARKADLCLLCGKIGTLLYSDLRDRLFGVEGTWLLMRCSKCDLVWLTPRPDTSDIDKLYKGYYTHQFSSIPERGFAEGLRRAIKEKILQEELGYSINPQRDDLIVRLLSKMGLLKELVVAGVMYLKAEERGKLLDVGCGNGQFLARMQELGWEVIGVEPDPKAVSIAREHFGLNVFQGTLEEIKFPDESFDAITMNHVIEHVSDPVRLLVECRRILSPGGKLVVVTPNMKSLGSVLFGKYWLHWDPPRHLFVFSADSLRACIEQAGLKTWRVWTATRGACSIWSASCLLRKKQNPYSDDTTQGFGMKVGGIVFWVFEYGICKLGCMVGEEIVVLATK